MNKADLLQGYVFATKADYDNYKNMNTDPDCTVKDNRLFCGEQIVAELVSIEQMENVLRKLNAMSLEPARKMPSPGWKFELFKNKSGLLEYEFTKEEWRHRGCEYVNVSFEVCNPFEREGAAPLLSYFQEGGLLEEIAIDVCYRYDRLCAKFKTPVYKVEDVPELASFMQTYMPMVYSDLLETVTYALLEEFDPTPYVAKIIKEHYTYE